jgi:hypothetical protein
MLLATSFNIFRPIFQALLERLIWRRSSGGFRPEKRFFAKSHCSGGIFLIISFPVPLCGIFAERRLILGTPMTRNNHQQRPDNVFSPSFSVFAFPQSTAS